MAKILLVANPGDHHELTAALRGGDDDGLFDATLVAEVGDDATLARFIDLRPDVVVVSASLEDGDARALISAMRDAVLPARPFVILVGDVDGPLRTAIDAIGVGIDRFVTRPLSAKALRFAVTGGLARAALASESAAGPRPAVVAATPEVPTPAASAGAVPVAAEPIAAADLRARWAALADQLGDDEDEDVEDDAGAEVDGEVAKGEGAAVEDASGEGAAGEGAAVEDASGEGAAVEGAAVEAAAVASAAVAGAAVEGAAIASVAVASATVEAAAGAGAAVASAAVEAAAGAAGAAAAQVEADDSVVEDDDVDAPDRVVIAIEDLPTAGTANARRSPAPPAREPTLELPAIAPPSQAPPPLTRAAHTVPPPPPGARRPPAEIVADDDVLELDDVVDEAAIFDEAPRFDAAPSLDAAAVRGGVVPVDEAPALPPTPIVAEPAASPVELWRPGSTEVPGAGPDDGSRSPLIVPREPTLVLTEPVPGSTPVVTWSPPPHHGEPAVAALWPPPPERLTDDLDDDLDDDVAAGLDDDLSVDLTRERDPSRTPLPAPVAPAGGDFARELRKKMSLMAERLFRGADLPAAPVAIGPAHDHHTEIDLGGLVDDGSEADLAAATFVGADERRAAPAAGSREPRDGRDPRGAEGGELARGIADAPALIARMFAADFTGRVVFRHGDAEKVVHFEGGRPVFASSNLVRDRMGELLVREGKITREQHDRCQDLVRDTGRRMGEILVDRGYLKRRELLPAVRRHVEDILYSLFAWDTGDYRIVAGDGATSERIRLSRHPAAMVLEGVRRKLDRATLERLVGAPTTIIETTDRDKLAATIGVADLSAEERAALAALDGATELAAVARHAGLSLASLYPLVWSLQLLGLASARRRPGDDDGDAPALVGESDLAIDRDRVRARAALVADADYFSLLGVRRDATGFEIKRAYEAARRDFAPESFPGELRRELEAELDEIAEVIDEAYRVLRDDALRGAYRAHLREPGEAA